MSETSNNVAGFGTFEEEIDRAKQWVINYEAAVADECVHFQQLIMAIEGAGKLVSGNAYAITVAAVVSVLMETQAEAARARALSNQLQADFIKQVGAEP